MKFVLALVTPMFNLFLLAKGGEFYGWLAELVIETRIDKQSTLRPLRDEILPLVKCYNDVNSLMSGFVVASAGAVVFVALDPRPALRLLLPLCYLALGFLIAQHLRALRRTGELSGYNSVPEVPGGTKSSIRRLRKGVIYLSAVPAAVALLDQLFGMAAKSHFVWLSGAGKFLLGQ